MSTPQASPDPPNGRLAPRVPPVAVTLIVAALMWALSRSWPSCRYDLPGRELVTAALVLVAAAVGSAGLRAFHHARTTPNPLRPEKASALVTGGIYRYTRNPMYVALAIALLGWAIWLGHALATLGVVAFIGWMDRLQIPAEERALRALFGDEFVHYCSEVRRWL
jgi:protein-S-isoprenylcysteine O-methyltransferase Ste14